MGTELRPTTQEVFEEAMYKGEGLVRATYSPSLSKIAEALAKAQGAIVAAEKDRTNPHFGQKYATLSAIWEVIRKPLSDNGLAVVQNPSANESGVTCETTLLHTSGESLKCSLWLPVAQKTPQGYGSAITYARRYSLSSMVGVVADEDDDGNAASAGVQPPPPKSNGHNAMHGDPRPEPPPPAETNPRERPREVIMRFPANIKGLSSHAITDKDLAFVINGLRKSIDEPDKARFREANERELHALLAEVNWRASGRTES